jgi:hypothetical protein
MRAREFTEALDRPYYLHWEHSTDGDVRAVAELPADEGYYNEGLLHIIFEPHRDNKDGSVAWEVEFWRNEYQDITGEGDQFRVFATVLQAINEFVAKYKPINLSFTATKKVEPWQKSMSRANLYDRLVQRYARASGYRAFRADAGNNVHYELVKINKGVSEGAMKDLDIDIQDQQWDAIVGYVVDGVKKGMDTDRMELALYKWASRELVDVEQALEDHGFRDIADLADHIEQHNGNYVPPSDFGLGNLGRGVAEHNLQELGTSVYKVSEPKNNTEYNNNQVVSKNYKFRVGKNLFLVTFLVTDRKVEGSSSVLQSLEANFGIYDPSGYEYDNIQYDITDKHKNQFKIYSTVLTVLQNFMTKYGKDINQIRFPGYSSRQDEIYEKFFKSRYLEKYLPGFSYDPKSRTLIRNGIKLEPEQIEVKAKKQRK